MESKFNPNEGYRLDIKIFWAKLTIGQTISKLTRASLKKLCFPLVDCFVTAHFVRPVAGNLGRN